MIPLLGFAPLPHARALSGRGPKGSGGGVVAGPAGEQGFVGELASAGAQLPAWWSAAC